MVGLTRAVELLESAVHYGLESVEGVRQSALTRSTPCAGWDLEALLCHLNESLAALHEGVDGGCIGIELTADPDPGTRRAEDLVAAFQHGARQMLDGWRRMADDGPQPTVGGRPIDGDTVALVGAVEIAVHGWDIAEACGIHRPIPVRLALDVLRWTPLIVDDATRPALFAAPVDISALASPSDRLVAFLGRNPRAWAAESC